MVIDDDEDFTNIYKNSLRTSGFDVTAVNQSSAALDMAYLMKPDVFVIDLMMPDIDGFQLCRMIRADPVFNRTPIIIVTALTDVESKKVAMDAEASAYLTKPFSTDELKSSINALLQSVK